VTEPQTLLSVQSPLVGRPLTWRCTTKI